MANYDVDFSDDGFAGLMSVNLDNGEGPYEVRVLKKWAVRDYCSSGKLGDVAMVLIDKNCHKIQAAIPNSLLAAFDGEIHEGRVYQMSSFTVRYNFGYLVPCYHVFRLMFNENTNYDLGAVMVQGVEGVTKVFVNPWTAGVVDFRKRLIRYLSGSSNYGGLIRRSALLPFSRNLEFIKKYPIKAIFELKNDPTLALILGGIPHVIALKIFENYIGAFHCSKCRASEYIVAPKVRLTIEVDDITGYTVFNAFDHVMVDVAVRNSHVSGSATLKTLKSLNVR
ncbi:replication factor A protein [Trifolium repens]|nr:replication factor A protein [Trifolium repens]